MENNGMDRKRRNLRQVRVKEYLSDKVERARKLMGIREIDPSFNEFCNTLIELGLEVHQRVLKEEREKHAKRK